ncbi:MAG: DUF2797 domain-containing protein [Candidatus Thorarchaeota archaeon]
MQIIDVAWRTSDDGTYESGLRIWREGADSLNFLPISPGKHLNWSFKGPKRCIGNIDSTGKLVKCPEEAIILRQGTRCGPCSAVDFYDPCIRCDGRTCGASEARKKQCDLSDYAVYVVVFNDSTLKIGVSSKKRVRLRWIEQGADFGGIVETITGGRKARRLEDRLGKRPNVTKVVRGERKIKSLQETLDIEVAQSIVDDFIVGIESIELGTQVQLENLFKHYSLPVLKIKPTPWRKRSDPINQRPLVGDVIGMKGSLLVTSIASSYTVTDLKQVVGYGLDSDGDITMVTQSGLLDFF